MACSGFLAEIPPTKLLALFGHWSYSVKQMLDAAGYEVPGPKAEFDLRAGGPDRSGEVILDSTISYQGFDLAGGEAIPLFRIVLIYPDPEVEIIVESFFENNAWAPAQQDDSGYAGDHHIPCMIRNNPDGTEEKLTFMVTKEAHLTLS